jgi:hypothetical protein
LGMKGRLCQAECRCWLGCWSQRSILRVDGKGRCTVTLNLRKNAADTTGLYYALRSSEVVKSTLRSLKKRVLYLTVASCRVSCGHVHFLLTHRGECTKLSPTFGRFLFGEVRDAQQQIPHACLASRPLSCTNTLDSLFKMQAPVVVMSRSPPVN